MIQTRVKNNRYIQWGRNEFILGEDRKFLLISKGGLEPIFPDIIIVFPKFREGSILRSSPVPPSLDIFLKFWSFFLLTHSRVGITFWFNSNFWWIFSCARGNFKNILAVPYPIFLYSYTHIAMVLVISAKNSVEFMTHFRKIFIRIVETLYA